MSFQIPLHFEDLARPSAGAWQARARHEPPAALLELLQHDLRPLLARPPAAHFHALFALIARYQTLSRPHRAALLALLHPLPGFIAPQDPDHRKLALCFAAGLVAAAANAPCPAFSKTAAEALLETAHAVVAAVPDPAALSDVDRDQLASQLVRVVLHVLELPSAARHKNLRPVLARCLAAALSLEERQLLPATTALLHALNRHEHLPSSLPDILAMLSAEPNNHTPFVNHFIREVATLSSDHLAHDPAAAKTIASFVAELSERLPQLFRANLPLFLTQLNADSYMIRNGVIHVIGALIRAQPNPEDPLLDVLMERSHRDINAFTRSKAFQTWIALADAKVIPNRLYPTLADMAASRLDDKAAAVRKYAAQLLSSLLQNNPFGPALRKSHFQEKLDELTDAQPNPSLPQHHNPSETDQTPEAQENGHELAASHDGSGSENEGGDESHPEVTALPDEEAIGNLDNHAEGTQDERPESDLSPAETEAALKQMYYSTAVSFISSVEGGLETVYNMLRSKNVTDVSESVSLLISAIQFQLEAASGRAVRKMLPLVLARETNIRQAAVLAYVRLLAPGGLDTVDDKEPAMAVAKGLTALGLGATTGELACLEALISSFCASDDVNIVSPAVIAVLWDMFAGRVPGASDEQRRAACVLISMVAAEKPESLQQRIKTMETVGLEDPSFARWACVAFCKLPSGSDPDNHLSTRLSNLIKTSKDLPTVEQAVTAIFSVSSEPEEIVGEVVRSLAGELYASPSEVQVNDLSRFLLVIGHVAVKELVRVEGLVNRVKQGIASQVREDGDNEGEEQAAAEADKALELAEKELVSPNSLLGRFGDLARKLAADQSAPAELQASAVLCMAKLMCVQESFCEKNLRLLFSILNSSSEPVVRSNSVTALGDLAFRFPNLVEPWSSHIYAALKDKDDKVRKNTLMALTHLILNDMIKVKGQIVGIAICILDENERIADLARLFFNELARKSANAIYNILPDTISCMSKMDDLTSDSFKKVISFLVGLMDRERHSDGMVEKLCHRFRTSESERETRDLAYCISLLNMSERGLKKLADNFKSYSSGLSDNAVHTSIAAAISKGTKPGISPGCQQILEELNRKIEEIRASSDGDDDSSMITHVTESTETTSTESRTAKSRQSRTRSRSRNGNNAIVEEQASDKEQASDEEQVSGEEQASDEEQVVDSENAVDGDASTQEGHSTGRRSSRRPARRKRIVEEDVTDDESEEDADVAVEDDEEEEDASDVDDPAFDEK